jgi:tRNA pseudouridine55 synthase
VVVAERTDQAERPRRLPGHQPPSLPAGGGLLLVDKPTGVTSHDVVGRARAVLRTRRVGHAGTLDPMATGLLVLGVDRATRLLGRLALATKSYTATIRLGQATTTDDAEGQPIGGSDAGGLTEAQLRAALVPLTGDILQVPSSVSAIKVDGQRAYRRVRDGEQVELAARPVTVSRFELVGETRPGPHVLDVDVLVDCSTGTYVRALARDLGRALDVGGHLTALRRTAVGPFLVADGADVFTPADVTQDSADAIAARVVPASVAVREVFGGRTATETEAIDLRHGRPVGAVGRDGTYGMFDGGNDLLALVEESGGRARPVLVWRAAG